MLCPHLEETEPELPAGKVQVVLGVVVDVRLDVHHRLVLRRRGGREGGRVVEVSAAGGVGGGGHVLPGGHDEEGERALHLRHDVAHLVHVLSPQRHLVHLRRTRGQSVSQSIASDIGSWEKITATKLGIIWT